MQNSIRDFINVFFPSVCNACKNLLSDNEDFICTDCRHKLPITDFHFNNDKSIDNVLYGRVAIEKGTALLRFEKQGTVQYLIHQLKYGGNEKVGEFFGKWIGTELKTIKSYNDIDIVIPVPLHPKKLKKRGFNQVEKFGKEIAYALQAEFVDDILIKISGSSKSQASKKRLERWQLNNELFSTKNIEKLNNKHILLVDDIITTGNTIESCCIQLQKANNIKISIACMAIA